MVSRWEMISRKLKDFGERKRSTPHNLLLVVHSTYYCPSGCIFALLLFVCSPSGSRLKLLLLRRRLSPPCSSYTSLRIYSLVITGSGRTRLLLLLSNPTISLRLTLLFLLFFPPSASTTSSGRRSSGIISILNQLGCSCFHLTMLAATHCLTFSWIVFV